MVRAAVLPMTVFAALAGIFAAAIDGHVSADKAIMLTLGLTLAHATNNLLNDWIDGISGIDRGNYFRTRYGVHVLESRLVDAKTFGLVTLITGLGAAGAGVYLVDTGGIEILYLMALGAFFVIFYTWPLKRWALGELSVLIVWGPLMTAGSYFVIAGGVSSDVMLLSIIYGIGPTLVIMGKHIDKYDDDRARGVLSLPVVIGIKNARRLSIILIVIQLVAWLAAVIYFESLFYLWFCAAALPALVALFRRLRQDRPVTRPDSYPGHVWPLWYSAFAFRYSRNFGALMVAGLLLELLV